MIYDITPYTKPRMTQRDKWLKPARPCVAKYWAYKAECRLKKIFVPESDAHITFYIPMPKSWSKKKKEEMNGEPHRHRPDKDNLEKGLLDALYDEDCFIWDSRVTKRWSYKGQIEILI